MIIGAFMISLYLMHLLYEMQQVALRQLNQDLPKQNRLLKGQRVLLQGQQLYQRPEQTMHKLKVHLLNLKYSFLHFRQHQVLVSPKYESSPIYKSSPK